jgi:hypothetical protein
MKIIINLCPHEVYEVSTNTKYPSNSKPARVKMESASKGKINGIETFASNFLPTENLPGPKSDTYYIVSALVLGQNPNRKDLLAPGIPVRKNGKPIGCSGFRRN